MTAQRAMGDPNFHPSRVTYEYRQTINAAADHVFPLLCPVRESEWLDGWQFNLIFSRSGLIEEGAVFTTPGENEADTVWIVTRHEPLVREIEFVRFTHGSRVCVLRIAVLPRSAHSCNVDIVYTYTSTSPAGNEFIEDFTQESFLEAVSFWERSLNHFLRTGRRLGRHE